MEFLVLFVAVGLGAVVQGSVGFGFALVVVPALTLVYPEALPATVLLLTMPMAATMMATATPPADVGLSHKATTALNPLISTANSIPILHNNESMPYSTRKTTQMPENATSSRTKSP